MKRFFSALLISIMVFILCACGSNNYNINGTYRTKTAYGMEDFYSSIEIEGNHFELEVEHFDETVEEYEGLFTMEDNRIILNTSNKKEFIYDSTNKTITNEDMETTWKLSKSFDDILD